MYQGEMQTKQILYVGQNLIWVPQHPVIGTSIGYVLSFNPNITLNLNISILCCLEVPEFLLLWLKGILGFGFGLGQ